MVFRMCLKVSSACQFEIVDNEGRIVGNYNNYVPDFFPGEHYGDYVEFDLDINTGVVTNWKKPNKKELEKLLKKANGQ